MEIDTIESDSRRVSLQTHLAPAIHQRVCALENGRFQVQTKPDINLRSVCSKQLVRSGAPRHLAYSGW